MRSEALVLVGTLGDLGVEIARQGADVTDYVQARAAALALASGQPGYSEALAAESVNVALFALGLDIRAADQIDERTMTVFRTILAFGVRALLM
jgi:hypothetical protein